MLLLRKIFLPVKSNNLQCRIHCCNLFGFLRLYFSGVEVNGFLIALSQIQLPYLVIKRQLSCLMIRSKFSKFIGLSTFCHQQQVGNITRRYHVHYDNSGSSARTTCIPWEKGQNWPPSKSETLEVTDTVGEDTLVLKLIVIELVGSARGASEKRLNSLRISEFASRLDVSLERLSQFSRPICQTECHTNRKILLGFCSRLRQIIFRCQQSPKPFLLPDTNLLAKSWTSITFWMVTARQTCKPRTGAISGREVKRWRHFRSSTSFSGQISILPLFIGGNN